MTGTLKVKTQIQCGVCGCELKRSKSFTVSSKTQEEAKLEVNDKIMAWKNSLNGINCKVCSSIIKAMK